MAGGLIGLAAGGALGYWGQQHAQKQQGEQQAKTYQQKFFMDGLHQHLESLDNAEIQKQGKKLFGDEVWTGINTTLQPILAGKKQEKKKNDDLMSMIGYAITGGKPPTGASPAGPEPAGPSAPTAPSGGGTPAQVPQSASAGPTSQQPAPPPAQSAPTGMEALDSEQKSLEAAQLALGQLKGASPDTLKSYQNVITQHLKDIEEKRKNLESPIVAAAKKRAELQASLDPEIQGQQTAAMVKKQKAIEAVHLDYAQRMATFHENLSEKLAKARGESKGQQKQTLVQKAINDLGKERVSLVSKLNDPKADQTARESDVATFNDTIDQISGQFDDPKQQEAIGHLKINVGAGKEGGIFTSAKPGAVTPAKGQEPSVPAGARAGRDKSGKIVGYSLNGKWTAL